MNEKIPLGRGVTYPAVAVVDKPLTIEERIELLTKQMEDLTKTFHALNRAYIKRQRPDQYKPAGFFTNKDNIPVGTQLVGISMRGGTHILTVKADGYYIGQSRYDSLSAAAEEVSGVRRSGWTFWRLSDSTTAKEAFGKS